MTEEQIKQMAEKRVKEWIEYAKKEYGWENAQYDLFEEPMFELCVQVAMLATKELQEENEKMKAILNSVAESNTYADLLEAKKKAKELLNKGKGKGDLTCADLVEIGMLP